MGFLHEEYRQHDFLLGRRNARSFLRNHFLLPECNPLFSAWSEDDKQRWGRIRTDARPVAPLSASNPLCGRLLPDDATEATEDNIEPLPKWPRGCLDEAALAALETAIRARAGDECCARPGQNGRMILSLKLRRKAEQLIDEPGVVPAPGRAAAERLRWPAYRRRGRKKRYLGGGGGFHRPCHEADPARGSRHRSLVNNLAGRQRRTG